VIFAGTAGGVWKTTDGGTNWTPLTDQQPNISVAALAMASSAPDTLFAATAGGILKTSDGGASWTSSMTDKSFNSIAIHPANQSIVIATSVPDQGLWRSSDGGASWTKILYPCTQVVFDPSDGSVVYAGFTQQGIFRSTDAGQTWNPVAGVGLPATPYSFRIAIAPSSPNILYVSVRGVDHGVPTFYRSTNRGGVWTQISVPTFDDFAACDERLIVHPTNPDLVYSGCAQLGVSANGGVTWFSQFAFGWNHQGLAFSPDGSTIYEGSSLGIWKTTVPALNTPCGPA